MTITSQDSDKLIETPEFGFVIKWQPPKYDALYSRGEVTAEMVAAYASDEKAIEDDFLAHLQAMEERLVNDFRNQFQVFGWSGATPGHEAEYLELPERNRFLYGHGWKKFLNEELLPAIMSQKKILHAPVFQSVENTASNPVQ